MIDSATPRTRAGLLQIADRLERARRASELLSNKEEALERERVRLEGHATRARQAWIERCRHAEHELLRARMFGASDELALLVECGPTDRASISPHWETSMGIAYPGSVECEPGERPAVTSTAALSPAIDAYRQALEAAVQHAAASAAVERLVAELAATRRRRRAIEDRLQPALETAWRKLDLHLDELDRDEALRVRIASKLKEADRA
jgi:V/A-type H+-transporting ATPase subunit D